MKLHLDWSSYENAGIGDAYGDIPKKGGDFAKAVAVCINSRQCQQASEKGVMCPSYRISENPYLSPGGRVKLLKAALNADNPSTLMNDAQINEAMALCVSCKGCKRECENEVDMALIMAEFLAQQNAEQKISLRRRLWAETPRLLRLPGARRLLLWRNSYRWLAGLGEKWLGISAKAPLPLPAIQPFQFKESSRPNPDKTVVLFIDTFSYYFNPQSAESAQPLLTQAGYQVEIALPAGHDTRPLCCGRTYFSNGFIDKARSEAKRLLQALGPHIAAGRTIVGLEPSCILSLRDEYLKLGLGEPARLLAQKSMLLEEFITREQAGGRWTLKFNPLPDVSKLMLHGHCHQKAVGAIKAMRKVLKQIPGLEFELIESSCCGMAGNFGLEQEHYPHAQAMAELALFPALRNQPDALLLSNGFSCQQQIANGGFAKPLHLAELLCMATPKQG